MLQMVLLIPLRGSRHPPVAGARPRWRRVTCPERIECIIEWALQNDLEMLLCQCLAEFLRKASKKLLTLRKV